MGTVGVDSAVIREMSVYTRLEEDFTENGHLGIRRFGDKPRFKEVPAPNDAAAIVDPVMDQANTLIFMINPPYALKAR